jgi:hypothetical protein
MSLMVKVTVIVGRTETRLFYIEGSLYVQKPMLP